LEAVATGGQDDGHAEVASAGEEIGRKGLANALESTAPWGRGVTSVPDLSRIGTPRYGCDLWSRLDELVHLAINAMIGR
jgi:hypothetical protein